MKARYLTPALLAVAILASGIALHAQQGSVTFTFGDRDRQAMRDWYRDNYTAREFQGQGDWNDQYEQRLRVGMVVPPDLRPWSRPAPQNLSSRLTPLQRGYRYVIIADHLLVVDDRWVIHDVNHFEYFEDPDRDMTRGWYRDNRNGPEFSNRGRWNDRFEQRVRVGAVLDADLRAMARPAPPNLIGRLPRRPPNLRYMLVGDHICLIDNRWVVRDIVHLENDNYNQTYMERLVVPAGTEIRVRTNERIDSRQANEGQWFSAQVEDHVRGSDGSIAIPRGSDATLVTRWIQRDGDITLDLQSIRVNGRLYRVSTVDKEVDAGRGPGANRRTGEFVGGGAVLGAIIGAIAGGGRGAAIGAASGAGAGVAAQIITRGKEVRVPAESVLRFRLDRPLRLQDWMTTRR